MSPATTTDKTEAFETPANATHAGLDRVFDSPGTSSTQAVRAFRTNAYEALDRARRDRLAIEGYRESFDEDAAFAESHMLVGLETLGD